MTYKGISYNITAYLRGRRTRIGVMLSPSLVTHSIPKYMSSSYNYILLA